MTSSSRNGSHRTSVMVDLLFVLIHCFRLSIRGSQSYLLLHTEKSARAANRQSETVNKNKEEVYHDTRTVGSVS